MPRILRAALMLAAITAGTLLPACSNNDNSQASPTTKPTTSKPPVTATGTSTTPESTTSAAPRTIEQEVEQAYQDITIAYLEQLTHPDPLPDQFEGHSGAHNDLVVSINREYASRGLAARPGPGGRWPTSTILEIKLHGDQAEVRVCIVDDVQIVESATGRIVNDQVESRLSQVTMERLNGSWVIEDHALVSAWPDNGGCSR